ncbi:MAG: OmpA family protein [Hyphomicrobium sp.]
MPALAGDYSSCVTAVDTVSCVIDAAEFSRDRNAEIEASIARVERVRAREYATSVTHCKSRFSRTPRCLAERANRFAAHQNALITASIARVQWNRAYQAARRAEFAASVAAIEAEQIRRLEIRQNDLINASIGAANAERQRRFAAQQNALATASVERVVAERRRQLAQQLAPCTSSDDARARCVAQRQASFVARQNALVAASLQRVQAERERVFAAARNAESARSTAAAERNRAAIRLAAYVASTSHCARNTASPRCTQERARELQASLTHCKSALDASLRCQAEREHGFQVARNTEIDRSLSTVAAARARGELDAAVAAASGSATSNTGVSPLETGAIGIPPLPKPSTLDLNRPSLRSISADPCRITTTPLQPVHFKRGTQIEADNQPELNRIASAAQTCPGMRIEVHGYTDGGAHFSNRSLSQARAQAVADYLIASGVSPNRVAAIGRGGHAPTLPYSEGFDSATAGRAEFVIHDPSMDAAARRVMWDLAELLDPTYIPAVANLSP